MQPLKLVSTVSSLWWKRYDKISLAYPALFVLLYFTANAKWLTAKPNLTAVDIISKFTAVDFSQSYNGLELMGWYFWLLLLPSIFSIALFNRISVLIINVFVSMVILFKMYDNYYNLESSIPFKKYLVAYIEVEKHLEIYLFFAFLSALLLLSIVNIFLPKKSR